MKLIFLNDMIFPLLNKPVIVWNLIFLFLMKGITGIKLVWILIWLLLFEIYYYSSLKWIILGWNRYSLISIDGSYLKYTNPIRYLDQIFVQLENLILYSSQNFVCENEIKPIFQSVTNPELNCVLNIKFL